jgi:hypothetical protein
VSPRRAQVEEQPEVAVTMRSPRDITIDVPGVVVVRCLGLDAFDRSARLFCEIEACDPWVETVGRVSVRSEGLDAPTSRPSRR